MQNLSHDYQAQLQSWAVLDWLIAGTLAISIISAFLKGLIASLVSLVGMCAGIFAALVYGPHIAHMLMAWVGPPLIARLTAFVLILVLVYTLVAFTGRLVRGACRAVGLGLFDRVAGAGFGLLRGILLLTSLTLPLEPYLVHLAGDRPSRLLPYLLQLSHGVSSVVPQHTGRQLFRDHFGL